MEIKSLKLKFYKHAVELYSLNKCLFYLVIVYFSLIQFFFIFFTQFLPSGSLFYKFYSDLTLFCLYIIVLMTLSWILFFKWYSVWFRYFAYFMSYAISLLRSLFNNIFFQISIVLGVVNVFFLCRDVDNILKWSEWANIKKILDFSSIIRTFTITALIFSIRGIIRGRRRIFISEFRNFTGIDNLKNSVDGIASRILNEMNRLTDLLKTIDEIQPKIKMGVIEATIDIQDIGKEFGEIIGPGSKVSFGKIEVPIKLLYEFFVQLIRGPVLSGGLHKKGKKFVLIACLKGGKLNGSWEVSSDDFDIPFDSRSEELIKMTDQLVCRIFTGVSRGGSPRWRAMRHYNEGLRLYRESLRSGRKKILKLIESKHEFSLALREDSQFVQCYYNLGVIYKKIKSLDAAKAAFYKGLGVEPNNSDCYFQLASIYHEQGEEYGNTSWLCERARTIQPDNPKHWNLLGVSRYRELNKNEIDDHTSKRNISREITQNLMTASALSWRALCKAIIKGEKVENYKHAASICIRNLAITTGLRKEWNSKFLFEQALFLFPDNNDITFELGKYYFRIDNIKKAYEAFKQVFARDEQIVDPLTFWIYYFLTIGKLYGKDKKYQNNGIINDKFQYFLAAIANKILAIETKPSQKIYKEIKQLRKDLELMSNILSKIADDKKRKQIEFIRKYFNANKNEKCGSHKVLSGLIKKDSNNVIAEEYKFFNILSESIENKPKTSREVVRLKKDIIKLENESEILAKAFSLHSYLAEVYLKKGQYEEALTAARIATQKNPYDPLARKVLGKVYLKLKNYEAAITELEISFNLNPKEKELWEYIPKVSEELCKTLTDSKQKIEIIDSIIEFLTQVLTVVEDKSFISEEVDIKKVGKIHYSLGMFLHKQKNNSKAKYHFRIAGKYGYKPLTNCFRLARFLLK